MLRTLRSLCLASALLTISAAALAQGNGPGVSITPGSWTPLANQPTFSGTAVPILLTDGTVMVNEAENYAVGVMSNHWYKLTPDAFGSYINGTWSQLADMDPSYAPLFEASAVLADGRVVVAGGEYNLGAAAWTNKAAIYDPTTNT